MDVFVHCSFSVRHEGKHAHDEGRDGTLDGNANEDTQARLPTPTDCSLESRWIAMRIPCAAAGAADAGGRERRKDGLIVAVRGAIERKHPTHAVSTVHVALLGDARQPGAGAHSIVRASLSPRQGASPRSGAGASREEPGHSGRRHADADADANAAALHLGRALKEPARTRPLLGKLRAMLEAALERGDGPASVAVATAVCTLLRVASRRPEAGADILGPLLPPLPTAVDDGPPKDTAGRDRGGCAADGASAAGAGRIERARIELGRSLAKCDRHAEALRHLESAIGSLHGGVERRCAEAGHDDGEAKQMLADAKVEAARSMYALGGKQEAADLVMSVVQDPCVGLGGSQHFDGLLEYARIAVENGMRKDGIGVLLSLIAKNKDHGATADLLATAVMARAAGDTPEGGGNFVSNTSGAERSIPGFADVLESLGGGGDDESTAAALAFVGTVVKRGGATRAATAFLARAVQMRPLRAAYVLNLMHAHELHGDADSVLSVSVSYLSRMDAREDADVVVGSAATRYLDAATVGEILAIVREQPGTFAPLIRAERAHGADADVHRLSAAFARSWPDSSSSSPRIDGSGCGGIAGGTGAGAGTPPVVEGDALDALAVAFTLVKVLYMYGAVGHARAVSLAIDRRLDALRAGVGDLRLHTTSIRNESAYYMGIAKIMREYDMPRAAPDALGVGGRAASGQEHGGNRPVFLVGDSHCMSLAWRDVRLGGERRTLFPLLVTGVKLWHLRRDSVFYTKQAFRSTVSPMPAGATAVFTLGDIDCREGLPAAVERYMYDDMDRAIDHLVDIYMDVLRSFVERDIEVIVHPPPPVLDVIRDTTLRFTEALRGRVHGIRRRKEWRHSESGAHLLHFLSIDRRSLFQDTGPDSMEPAALRLRPEYVLDGTHMSPAYLGVLQAALDEMYVES